MGWIGIGNTIFRCGGGTNWITQEYPDGTITRTNGSGIEYSNDDLNINQYYTNRTPAKLDFPSVPIAGDTAIHPGVIDFHNEIGKNWNGYRFWMTYTPLPESDPNNNEVPCILVSNDKVNWIVPSGGSNPITPHSEVSYMADPSLYFEKETNTLYIIYLNSVNKTIEGKSSTNGITWSSSFIIYQQDINFRSVSPSIVKVNGMYRMYCVDATGTPGSEANIFAYVLTASNITGPWGSALNIIFDTEFCDLGDHELTNDWWYPWHIQVIKISDRYIMALYPRLMPSAGARYLQQMWLAVSTNGVNFKVAKYPLFQENKDNYVEAYWDEAMYKFSITPEIIDNKLAFNCWYSGWGNGYDAYPVYIGYALIQNFDKYILGDLGNSFNLVPYNTELGLAVAKTAPFVLGDTFSRNENSGLGTSDSGYIYTYGTYNYFKVANGYAYPQYVNPLPEFFINLNKDYEWQVDMIIPSNTAWIYLKYIDENNSIVLYPSSPQIFLRKGGSNTSYYSYINRCVTTELNRWKIKFVGAKVQVFVNEVLQFEKIFVVSDFIDQAQMDSFINNTVKGFGPMDLGTKIYSMTLKSL